LKEARNELYNLLEADDDEVNVYYLTPSLTWGAL
jgi:hypothetical protein